MYIPLAVHKNELVLIDSMESFSHYFCLAKRQKMTPLAAVASPGARDEEDDEEKRTYYGDGAAEINDEDEL